MLIGKTAIGGSWTGGLANLLDLNGPYSATNPVKVGSAYVYMRGHVAVTSKLRLVIYNDAAGTPSTLAAVSAEVTITASQPAGWVPFTLTSVSLPAGSYWIGVWKADVNSDVAYDVGATGIERTASATYSSSADPPSWPGGGSTSTTAYSFYLDGFHVIDGGRGVLPELCVEVDVTNAPTIAARVWSDVTPQIRQLTYTRSGRNDELQRTAPGTLSVLADNRADVLTNLGIKKAQWIRVRAQWAGVTYPRWQGIIETIPKQWPSAGHDATVEIHAADVLKVFRMYDLADETFGAQRNDQRVSALAALAGVTTSSIDTDTDAADAISTPISQGSDALAMLIQIEESENGLAVAEPDGTLSFQGRHWRLRNSATPIAVLGEGVTDIPYRDTVSLEDDDTRIANIVSVTPLGGSAVVVSDAASQALYWNRRLNRDLLTSDTGIAADAANYLLGRYKDPSPRIPSIEPIMVSRTSSWPVMLAAGNSSRITWTRAATTPLSKDAYVEQIAETVTPGTDWQMMLQLSPASDEAGWVLGDATNSLIGVSTVLVY